MKLSVVTTLYLSQEFLREFYTRISAEVKKITNCYEIILVNDGSPDHSLELALDLFGSDSNIILIDLSRNFGQHKAMMTGLAHASGDLIFLLDCDLEEEPELLGVFYEQMQRSGADVVFGVQKSRKGRLLERISGEIFFFVFNLLSNIHITPNLIHARLMSSRYVKNLIRYCEHNIYIPGLMTLTGFTQAGIPVDKHYRGNSTYNLSRKFGLMLMAITSFSTKPLQFIFHLGLGMLTFSIFAMIYTILKGGLTKVNPEFSLLVLLSIWILGSLIIFCLGILAIYLSTVLIETKQRPYTVIRQVYTHRM